MLIIYSAFLTNERLLWHLLQVLMNYFVKSFSIWLHYFFDSFQDPRRKMDFSLLEFEASITLFLLIFNTTTSLQLKGRTKYLLLVSHVVCPCCQGNRKIKSDMASFKFNSPRGLYTLDLRKLLFNQFESVWETNLLVCRILLSWYWILYIICLFVILRWFSFWKNENFLKMEKNQKEYFTFSVF